MIMWPFSMNNYIVLKINQIANDFEKMTQFQFTLSRVLISLEVWGAQTRQVYSR